MAGSDEHMSDGATTATVAVHLERSPLAARTARNLLLQLLGDGPSIAFVRDAVLLTSELVSNALLHTAGEFDLEITYRTRPDRVRVEVTDESSVVPTIATQTTERPRGGGLGLRLIDDVATAWGVLRRTRGKTVWFQMEAS